MAKILLIETSSEVCSAAISIDGQVVAVFEDLETQSHAALLTLQIRDCCEKAGMELTELEAVAVSKGPGAYTALRVGASVAKGICYALDKPLIAIDSLLILAHASVLADAGQKGANSTLYIPLLDARRQEVWLALYDANLHEIAPAQALILENNSFEIFRSALTGDHLPDRIVLSGNGMEKTRSGGFFEKAVFSSVSKSSASYLSALAEDFFQRADFQEIAYFEPFYMKPPNITTPNKPLF